MRAHLRAPAIVILLCALAGPATADVLEYSGRGTVVGGTLLGLPIGIVDTGPLPPAGGMLSAGLPTFDLLGLISAETLEASTEGVGKASTADANVEDLVVTVGLATISATVVSSEATATCAGDVASASGSATVVGLVVNGMAITVTGVPNQVVPCPSGSDRSSSTSSRARSPATRPTSPSRRCT